MCLLAALCSTLGACAPEIGDECSTSADCATTDQSRLCLIPGLEGFPGGYCTVFNCEPGSCPSESVCVGFRTTLANAPECDEPGARARLQQTYCMRTCGSDGDCRPGYACVDVAEDNAWGAAVLEEGKRANRTKICTVAYSEPEEAPARSAEVCAWELPPGAAEPTAPSDAGASGDQDAMVPTMDAAVPLQDAASLLQDAASLGDAAGVVSDASGQALLDATPGSGAGDAATNSAGDAATEVPVPDSGSDAAL